MFGNALLIVNPFARSGKARRTVRKVSELLEGVTNTFRGHYYETMETGHPCDAIIIARDLGEHFDTVFVLGGDGAIHETVNGLMQLPPEKRPTLAVLPAGQGNDLARSLALPLDPLRVLDRLPDLEEKTIDIGMVNGTYFTETLSFGIDASIALETMERRRTTKKTGTILYLESGFNQIKNNLEAFEASLSIDGQEISNLSFYTFAIQNGATYGGGFKICPEARLDDGLLNICYATPPLSRLEAARLFLKAKSGKHVDDEHIHFMTGKDITLHFDKIAPAQVDGEPISAYDLHVSIVPGALRVLSL